MDSINSILNIPSLLKKPNCCFICKELLEPILDSKTGLELLTSDHDPIPSKVACLTPLCNHWKSWEPWDKYSGDGASGKIKQLMIAIDAANCNQSKQYRRYCIPCVHKMLLSQLEEQTGTRFDFQNKRVNLKCLFCKDLGHSHTIHSQEVIYYLKSDKVMQDRFKIAVENYIAQRDIHNKHCPIPNCSYFERKGSEVLNCPEHGSFCTNCFDLLNTKTHKCPGVMRELWNVKNLKKCPNCKSLIEKRDGCNHMTCVCKHQFYWNQVAEIKPKKKKVRKPSDI